MSRRRLVSDAVTTLGSGVDGSVRRIDTAYDGQIVNQVRRAFNGLG
ncbi:MAG TPA: hypothetical protein VLM40_11365 [Gemmata sp.]|nr:hypothetical protein [Gemmata sp.]